MCFQYLFFKTKNSRLSFFISITQDIYHHVLLIHESTSWNENKTIGNRLFFCKKQYFVSVMSKKIIFSFFTFLFINMKSIEFNKFCRTQLYHHIQNTCGHNNYKYSHFSYPQNPESCNMNFYYFPRHKIDCLWTYMDVKMEM